MGDNSPRVGRPARRSKPDLWYYDKLPPTARQALANAMFDWSAGQMYGLWNKGARGFKTGADIAEQVKRADASVIEKTRGVNR